MNAVDLGVNLFVALFALLDPIGNVPIFAAATAGASLRQRISVSAMICLFAVVFLGFFFFTGLGLLQFFGISLAAFRIAGGILLLLTALDMLFERRTQRREGQAHDDDHDPSIFPLAMPLIAGPGALVTMVLLVGERPGWGHWAAITGIMLLNLGIVLALFAASRQIARALGRTGTMVITRLLGMLLALSVQFIIDGIRQSALLG